MKHLLTIFLTVYTLMSYAQFNTTPCPDQSSNYRFIGDTTTYCSDVSFEKTYDIQRNCYCYIASNDCSSLVWSKHHGYVRIWWIDVNSGKWINNWMMGYYWTYVISSNHKEIKFDDLKEKRNAIKVLNEL